MKPKVLLNKYGNDKDLRYIPFIPYLSSRARIDSNEFPKRLNETYLTLASILTKGFARWAIVHIIQASPGSFSLTAF